MDTETTFPPASDSGCPTNQNGELTVCQIDPPVPSTTTVAMVGTPRTLPHTGATTDALVILGFGLVCVGAIFRRTARHGR